MVTLKDYQGLEPAWCPGCGNFGILQALNRALVILKLKPHQVLMVSGIGQAAKLPHYSRANVFNSLHGRPLPVAIGARLANPELTVIAISGDGDGYGEGGNHFLHAIRRNHDITYLVHDNQVYGLTKGQASPTSDEGFVTRTSPEGAVRAINPTGTAVMGGATFVARSFAGDVEHLSGIIQKGIKHKGFSLIDILQPCVSFNRKNTYQWYRERVYRLDKDKSYDPHNRDQALSKAAEWGDRIPIGIIYKDKRTTFEDRQSALKKGPLVKQDIIPARAAAIMKEYY